MAQGTMRDREDVMGDAGEAAVRTAGGAIRNAMGETPHDARGGMPAHRELTLPITRFPAAGETSQPVGSA